MRFLTTTLQHWSLSEGSFLNCTTRTKELRKQRNKERVKGEISKDEKAKKRKAKIEKRERGGGDK